MLSLILHNAKEKIDKFNSNGLHYNLVAQQIYNEYQQTQTPFDKSFLPFIIAGLASFDMGRMMGASKYSFDNSNFATRLYAKLQILRPLLEPLLHSNIVSTNLQQHSDEIVHAYTVLSESGPGALHQDPSKSFHVGTSKVLHFLNPKLFIIVDSNAARAFKAAHNILFRKNAPQGYSAERYLECMKLAKRDISDYGNDKFQALEPDTPITRIYDKLTFVTGSELLN